ncbi:MAG TPA: peptidoglycan recognition family protein [Thermoleophilia bacterium]|nr:peptidoglycan recognition family protein [Thermoleophilia bacterium]
MGKTPKPIQCVRRKLRILWAVEKFELKRAPGFGPKTGRFGRPAQEQTKIVQRHFGMRATGQWSTALKRRLDKAGAPSLIVVKHKWPWRGALSRRIGKPIAKVWHHAAAVRMTVQQVWNTHINNGWTGIGYTRYIEKSGRIHAGRPLWAYGAHAGTSAGNAQPGICCEGNYDGPDRVMPLEQRIAAMFVDAELDIHFGRKLVDKRHRDYVPTACPGRHFPFDRVTS